MAERPTLKIVLTPEQKALAEQFTRRKPETSQFKRQIEALEARIAPGAASGGVTQD